MVFNLFRSSLFIPLFLIILFFSFGGVSPAGADEYSDAKFAFGAFEDGFYDVAQDELEQFLQLYPESEMLERIRLALIMCSLELGDCRQAAVFYSDLEKPSEVAGFGVESATLLYRLGRCFLFEKEKKRARFFFDKLIKEHPQNELALVARFELARLFFAEKNFVAANRVVTPLLAVLQSSKPIPPQVDRQMVLWIAALSRYQLKKFKACLPLLQEIVDDPENFSFSGDERQDLYSIMIECAWHCKKQKTLKTVLRNWLKIPEDELKKDKLSAALRLAADLLQGQGCLADIRGELTKVVGFGIPQADKIALYGALIEIDHNNKDEKSLKSWYEAVILLQPTASPVRINYLQSLLLLNYQQKDYAGSAAVGRWLLKADGNFWQQEHFYFPYLNSLGQLGKCREIVKYIPARLPPYGKTEAPGKERRFLDMLASNCLQELGRFDDAIDLYRSIYNYNYRADPLIRVKLLAKMYSLASKINERQKLNDWISAEVVAHFSLDRRENEMLLREFPELVLLVADHFFRARAYTKAQPSLLWLEKLYLKGELADRVTFLLAEVYYRCEDLVEALVRYQALYVGDSKEFRYLAALRLVTIYEAQGYRHIRINLYKDLLRWESNPAVKADLKRKLEELEK